MLIRSDVYKWDIFILNLFNTGIDAQFLIEEEKNKLSSNCKMKYSNKRILLLKGMN